MKKILFYPADLEIENFLKIPEPSKKFIPEWYSKIKHEYTKCPVISEIGKLQNTDLKMCMPFYDSLTSGYIQSTWTDIYIHNVDGEVKYSYSSSPQQMSLRKTKSVPHFNKEYYDLEFVWLTPWSPKVPKGYSLLITHPLNRFDLPFTTLSGIIDSDLFYHSKHGNHPFFIKAGFEGLIPAGTPMFQIIPIKRESWVSTKGSYDLEAKHRTWKNSTKFWGFYKNNFWQKKDYN